ncbi:MAG: hypothetical protein GF408_02720 [Candidatus Omnitrophica bacterium]|nr:hypothetical protein [Candidatus Omnitrophota bacterium]
MMTNRKIYIFCAALIASYLPASGPGRAAGNPDESVSMVTEETREATDREGQLARPYTFYLVKFSYDGNFYSVNIPKEAYGPLEGQDKKKIVYRTLGLYRKVFGAYRSFFGDIPSGYRFSVTFGKTSGTHPYNRIYLYGKNSNIYPDFVPGKNRIFTRPQEAVLLHEIGHSLFAIAVGGYLHPRNRALEEGFVDMMVASAGYDTGTPPRIPVSREDTVDISGLSQLDIEISIWGEEKVLANRSVKGYLGLTHHSFGREFFAVFMDIFGTEKLPEFLARLKATEGLPPPEDHGTEYIEKALREIGADETTLSLFREKLHGRIKKNLLTIS